MWQQSDLTQIKWCQENNVNIHNFKYWKTRINKIEADTKSKNGFVAIKPTMFQENTSIKLNIGPATIHIDASTNLDLLNDVVKVLMLYA